MAVAAGDEGSAKRSWKVVRRSEQPRPATRSLRPWIALKYARAHLAATGEGTDQAEADGTEMRHAMLSMAESLARIAEPLPPQLGTPPVAPAVTARGILRGYSERDEVIPDDVSWPDVVAVVPPTAHPRSI